MPNNVTVESDLDKNLKPLKVGNTATSIEVSDENGARVNGDLEITGKISNLRTEYIENKSGDVKIALYGDVIVESINGQDLHLVASGVNTITLNNGATGNTYIVLRSILDEGDYFKINTTTNGVTTLTTVDDDGTGANLTLDIDGAVDINSSASDTITLDAGTSIELDATSSGVSTGILLKNAGTLIGDFTVHHNATFFRLYENGGASGNDHLSISCAASGASTIQTNDAGGTAAHLKIIADGAIELDSTAGKFIARNAGTEFSSANSAYAGMILGYRCIGEDVAHETYTLTTSFVVPDSDMTVRFIVPPSGAVEVMIQIFCDTSTSGRIVYFGLSDNLTYNSLGVQYEQLSHKPDETDDRVHTHRWTVSGLNPGDTLNYWLGAKINATVGYLRWGGDAALRYPEFIMKVIALPAPTADFAVYG